MNPRRHLPALLLLFVGSGCAALIRLVPDHPVVPQPVVTLRLKHGLKMVVERRDRFRPGRLRQRSGGSAEAFSEGGN